MKKIVALLLAAALVFIACACGSHNQPVESTDTTTLADTQNTTTTSTGTQPATTAQTTNPPVPVTYTIECLFADGDYFEMTGTSFERLAVSFPDGAQPTGLSDGDVVEITYDGMRLETYPVQIHATSARVVETRNKPFDGPWIWNEQTAGSKDLSFPIDVEIYLIYADCFFAHPLGEKDHYVFRVDGTLPESYNTLDLATIVVTDTLADEYRTWGKLDYIMPYHDDPDGPFVCYKPIIYLYPEEETTVSIQLQLTGSLTCTYPTYLDGWTVKAAPDGTLTDEKGLTYNYLYWEGETHADWDMSHGFCVAGKDSAAFLETALAKLGLTRKEANEFIVFWLPQLEAHAYNIVSFQTDAYTNAAGLTVDPAPDTVIRVFLTFQAVSAYVDIPAQDLSAPQRTGFTVVEWGGTEIH